MDDEPARVDFDDEGEAMPGERGRVLPDLLRRMMALGLSGFFTTEAAIRGALGETVPREWIDFLSEQSSRTREELAKRLAAEFARVLEDVDLVELAEELLADRTIEVKAEIRLGRRTPAPDPMPPRRTS
jgi:hypothetical protein